MPSYEQLIAAHEYTHEASLEAAINGLPPGFGAGFRVTWTAPNLVHVGPGVANVNGEQVAINQKILLDSSSWLSTRRQGHFYIYLTSGGEFEVDMTGPVESTDNDFANYHPIHGARFLGRVYVDSSGDQVFATTGTKATPEVIVGASDWTDGSDYLCDGKADEEEINAAIKYLSDAFGGGVVNLTPGTYSGSAAVTPKSGITIRGAGTSTVIDKASTTEAWSNIYVGVYENVTLEKLKLLHSGLVVPGETATAAPLVAFSSDSLALTEITVQDSFYNGFSLSRVTNLLMHKCVAVDFQLGYGADIEACTGIVSDYVAYFTSTRTNTGGNAPRGLSITAADAAAAIPDGDMTVSNPYIHDLVVDLYHADIVLDTEAIAVVPGEEAPETPGPYRVNIIDPVVSNIREVRAGAGSTTGIRIGVANCVVRGGLISDVHQWAVASSSSPKRGVGIRVAGNNCLVEGVRLEDCDVGLHVDEDEDGDGFQRTMIAGVQALNCGQLIDYGNCESANQPLVRGETSPYTESAASYAPSTEQAYEGTLSYKLVSDGASAELIANFSNSQSTTDMHGLLAGVEYALDFWAYVPSGGITPTNIKAQIQHRIGSSWNVTEVTYANLTNGWQRVTLTKHVPADTTGLLLRLAVVSSGNHSINDAIYFDNVRLYPTNYQNDHGNALQDDGSDTRF